MRPRPRGSSDAIIAASCAAVISFALVVPALAYRPFDGTDAAVADPGRG